MSDPTQSAQVLLLACADHNIDVLRGLLRNQTPNVQDPDNGFTPLHSAIASCAPTTTPSSSAASNGTTTEKLDEERLERAKKTLQLLLQNGAIWNTLDNNNETPGCVAWRLGVKELYDVMVDAGVRAELLLSRLEAYEPLGDDDDDDEEEEEEGGDGEEKNGAIQLEEEKSVEDKDRDAGTMEEEAGEKKKDVNSEDYLKSELKFDEGKIVDEDLNGVMMQWESDIMEKSASLLLPTPSLRVLNIGFGMGIIDTFFQSHSPSQHHIVEAHPSVLSSMRSKGWFDKPSVTIHAGRWQDVLQTLVLDGVQFDAIYFDTFAEDYSELRKFFEEFVMALLDPKGRFGFFNGLGADRQVCYDVYAKVVEMDLFEAALDTEWTVIDVPKTDGKEWEGVKRRYWTLDKYRLPICTFIE